MSDTNVTFHSFPSWQHPQSEGQSIMIILSDTVLLSAITLESCLRFGISLENLPLFMAAASTLKSQAETNSCVEFVLPTSEGVKKVCVSILPSTYSRYYHYFKLNFTCNYTR